ncbi:MAG: NAD-dependent epimerase/dehydratase family protein [Candidatus Binataceae bacterium]
MKRVLVTGAAGFIGRHTLRPLLDSGFEVFAISHSRTRIDLPGVQWRTADLLEPDAASRLVAELKPSHLLHCAWHMAPADYRNSPENLRWCEASLALIRAFADGGGTRVVFAGTCFEYDARFGFCSETLTPVHPTTLYGICKNSLRAMALGFAERAGIGAVWGRTFFVYGPHEAENRLVASVIINLLRREPARCTHGEQVRDFMHVEDVASAFVALLESDTRGIVNIGSGAPVRLKDIINEIADALDARQMVRLGAVAAAADDPPVLLADVRRLHGEIGWRPSIPLEIGLPRTIEWWRRNQHHVRPERSP